MVREQDAIAGRIVALATELGVRIAVAESLTGGLVTATLVAVPGASRVLSGGVIAYDTALKASLLGVDRALLDRVGPVDGEVASQMAIGVRDACAVGHGPAAARRADIGVATTGVAGPDPDPQTGQPAGTVWIGMSSAGGSRATLVERVDGDRGEVRAEAVRAALSALFDELNMLASAHGDGAKFESY